MLTMEKSLQAFHWWHGQLTRTFTLKRLGRDFLTAVVCPRSAIGT